MPIIKLSALSLPFSIACKTVSHSAVIFGDFTSSGTAVIRFTPFSVGISFSIKIPSVFFAIDYEDKETRLVNGGYLFYCPNRDVDEGKVDINEAMMIQKCLTDYFISQNIKRCTQLYYSSAALFHI